MCAVTRVQQLLLRVLLLSLAKHDQKQRGSHLRSSSEEFNDPWVYSINFNFTDPSLFIAAAMQWFADNAMWRAAEGWWWVDDHIEQSSVPTWFECWESKSCLRQGADSILTVIGSDNIHWSSITKFHRPVTLAEHENHIIPDRKEGQDEGVC